MANEQVVTVGKMLSDGTRVALLDAMFDGRAYTVTELSQHVGVAQSTTSEHLGKLLDAGLVSLESQGRHRYYRLRGPEVAALLEQLFEFGHGTPVKRSSRVPAALVYARTCYDHLAGTLAVGLTEHFQLTGIVVPGDNGPEITGRGRELLQELGVTTTVYDRGRVAGRRPMVRACLDWSERKHHLAGSMPADLLRFMMEQRWFRHRDPGRGLELTQTGRRGLADAFAFQAPDASR